MPPKGRYFVLTTIASILALVVFSFPIASGRITPSSPRPTFDLSPTESDMVNEINLLRSDPSKYALYLEQMKKYYKGKDYKPPGQAESLTTIEGISAVDEAIKVLKSTKPLPLFSTASGMCLAARDHAKDIGRTGNSGHKGTDGSTVEVRMSRYGTFTNGVGENIFYESTGAREAVMGWLVDDGVSSRGHRRNLLSTSYRYLGVAVGDKTDLGAMCVLTFAGDYVDSKGSAPKGKPSTAKKI